MVNILPFKRSRDIDEGGSMLSRFRSEMDRLFDRFFEPSPGSGSTLWGLAGWRPSLELCDDDNEYAVCAELPGVDPKDINIQLHGSTLVISGTKRESEQLDEGGVQYSERRFGSFRRSIDLPSEVDPDNISAEYTNGVLTVHVPKSAQHKPKRIEVKSTPAKTSGDGHGKSSGQDSRMHGKGVAGATHSTSKAGTRPGG